MTDRDLKPENLIHLEACVSSGSMRPWKHGYPAAIVSERDGEHIATVERTLDAVLAVEAVNFLPALVARIRALEAALNEACEIADEWITEAGASPGWAAGDRGAHDRITEIRALVGYRCFICAATVNPGTRICRDCAPKSE